MGQVPAPDLGAGALQHVLREVDPADEARLRVVAERQSGADAGLQDPRPVLGGRLDGGAGGGLGQLVVDHVVDGGPARIGLAHQGRARPGRLRLAQHRSSIPEVEIRRPRGAGPTTHRRAGWCRRRAPGPGAVIRVDRAGLTRRHAVLGLGEHHLGGAVRPDREGRRARRPGRADAHRHGEVAHGFGRSLAEPVQLGEADAGGGERRARADHHAGGIGLQPHHVERLRPRQAEAPRWPTV